MPRVTRGTGWLEKYLSNQRASQANRLIPSHLRSGRILDIGCGSHPYFLTHTTFQHKFAIDRQGSSASPAEITWTCLDLNHVQNLPFEDDFFSVVTLLAVIEHLDPDSLVILFREIHRLLLPGGVLIVTTPAAWTSGLLKFLAAVNLVSREEIREHVYPYTLLMKGWYFGSAGFSMTRLNFGQFEHGLNLWAIAKKS